MENGRLRGFLPHAVAVECASALLLLITTNGVHHETFDDADKQVTVVEPVASCRASGCSNIGTWWTPSTALTGCVVDGTDRNDGRGRRCDYSRWHRGRVSGSEGARIHLFATGARESSGAVDEKARREGNCLRWIQTGVGCSS